MLYSTHVRHNADFQPVAMPVNIAGKRWMEHKVPTSSLSPAPSTSSLAKRHVETMGLLPIEASISGPSSL